MRCKYWITMSSKDGGEISIEKATLIEFIPPVGMNIYIDDFDTNIEYVTYEEQEAVLSLGLEYEGSCPSYEKLNEEAANWATDGWVITDNIPPKKDEA